MSFDYGMGQTNIDKETGIRYGVISLHEVCQAWCDSSEPDYGSPSEIEVNCGHCGNSVYHPHLLWGDTLICDKCGETSEVELPDCAEPIGHQLDDGEYKAYQSNNDSDIFVIESPFYTKCNFCSPCAPGAGYLTSSNEDGCKAYCFGHDWFDGGVAPYPVYKVGTDEPVIPDLK